VNRLRLGLALAGFVAALLAVSLGDERVGWAGIALLVGSLLVRLLQKRSRKEDMDARSDENDSM
jgi:predicted MFS family arabinose efflux permease